MSRIHSRRGARNSSESAPTLTTRFAERQNLPSRARRPSKANTLQRTWRNSGTPWIACSRSREAGKDAEAREQIRLTLQARQAALSTAVARLLVENNEREEQASAQVAQIYDQVQRQVYLFLTATLIAILLTSLYLIRSNRRLFAQLASLSSQRSELAQKLIATQESTLRYISRELHDEFGQILTAVGSMLARAEKHAPEGSPLRSELREVNEIAQTTLDNVRTLSQALHPVMLDETGLESTVDWYIPTDGKANRDQYRIRKIGRAFLR